MRELKSTDLFAAFRIVKEVGITEEMKRIAVAVQGEKVTAKTQVEVGTELLMSILANCGEKGAEQAFFEFLSGISEVSVDDLRDMGMNDFLDTIEAVVKSIDLEHWKSFFTSLTGLIAKQK